jgi:hypothetical protein
MEVLASVATTSVETALDLCWGWMVLIAVLMEVRARRLA